MKKINNVLNFLLMIILSVSSIGAMEKNVQEDNKAYSLLLRDDVITVQKKVIDSILAIRNIADLNNPKIDIDGLITNDEQERSINIILGLLQNKSPKQDLSGYSIDDIISILNCINKLDVKSINVGELNEKNIKSDFLAECLNRIQSASAQGKKAIISKLETVSLNYDDRQQVYADMKLREAYWALTLKKIEDPERISEISERLKSTTNLIETVDGTLKITMHDVNNRKDKKSYVEIQDGSDTVSKELPGFITSVSVNKKGSLFAVSDATNVCVWDIAELKKDPNSKPKITISNYGKYVSGLSFHPTEPLLYIGLNDSRNGYVYVWNIETDALVKQKSFLKQGNISQLFINETLVYIANNNGLTLLNFDLDPIIILPIGITQSVDVLENGNLIVAYDNRNRQTLWELDLNLKKEFTEGEIIFLISLSTALQQNKKLVLCEDHTKDLCEMYKSNPDLLQIASEYVQEGCSLKCSMMKKLKSYWNKEKK